MFDSSKYYRIELLSSPEKEKTDIIFQSQLAKDLDSACKRLCFNFLAVLPVFCIILGKSSNFFLLQLLLYTVEISPISLAH